MSHDSATAFETGVFTGLCWIISFIDWSYADSHLIGPLQHLVSIVVGIVAITVGAPVAYKHLKKAYAFIKSKIKP